MNRPSLEALARQWRRHRALRHTGLAIAAGCVATGVVFPSLGWTATALGLTTVILVSLVLRQRSPPIHAGTLAEHLNRRCPDLEESAALWLRAPGDLDLVERLQLRRLDQAWSQQPTPPPGQPPPRGLLPTLAALVASVAFLVTAVTTTPNREPPRAARPEAPRYSAPVDAPILSTTLEVQPPAYLGRPSRRVDTLSTEVEEGAEVVWRFVTTPRATGLQLLSHGTNAPLTAQALGNGRFEIRRTIEDTFVYQVSVHGSDGAKSTSPALHVLRVLRDRPPRLVWRSPAVSRTSLSTASNLPPVAIEVLAGDDHGVAEVRLRMTMAKGSGEGLRFQERSEILPGRPSTGSSNHTYQGSLDIAALGLEPGDELYLEAVAFDTRRPTPNESRTDSRCLVLAGPAATSGETAVMLSGRRLIPQYFRSQRQLILDTEQLVAEQATLPQPQFRLRSENLGIDQKLLRLRYGQFLGEEFEPASAGAPREAAAMEWAAALRNPSAQDADRGVAIRRAIEATHNHESGLSPARRPPAAQDLFAEIAHNHDSPEAATFFDEGLKTSLRAVLAAMWEAEGRLRTAQPADALPSEHRALTILKAIQQADRLFVSRVGSESPPLRIEERRLRGELDAIPGSTSGTPTATRSDPDAAALRLAVAFLAGPNPEQMPQDLTARVEDLLWRQAQAQPERYLPALERWRTQPRPLPLPDLEAVCHALWSLVPPPQESPHRRPSTDPTLGQRYADALDALASPPP